MIKNTIIGVIISLITLATSVVNATTYTYTGLNYTGPYGSYTTSMNFMGTFDTLAPLPVNMPLTAIGPLGSNIVTSWSFNDGLNVFDNTNSMELYGLNTNFSVSTDASGQINGYVIGLMSPDSPPAHVVFGNLDAFIINALGDNVADQGICNTVVLGVCTSIGPGASGAVVNAGVWAIVIPASVPSLSAWSMILLLSLLGFYGISRKSNALSKF